MVPASRSRVSALSRTVRVSMPWVARLSQLWARIGLREMRPRDDLSPTTPLALAGTRIEPPPSLPCATGTMPAATATAESPLEPMGV